VGVKRANDADMRKSARGPTAEHKPDGKAVFGARSGGQVRGEIVGELLSRQFQGRPRYSEIESSRIAISL
jgi:hypothetical protein